MAEPFSIATGSAGLISLAVQVIQPLVDYYTSYRNQYTQVGKTTDGLQDLVATLRALEKSLCTRQFSVNEQELKGRTEDAIARCEDYIVELQEESEKFARPSKSGIRTAMKVAGKRLEYPFRQSTLQRLDEDVIEIRENLAFALDILTLNDSNAIRANLDTLISFESLAKAERTSQSIQSWLSAPNVSIDHNQASAQRTPGTGDWFVNGPVFKQWLGRPKSFVWLQGFAGCGKSVLCSSVIQATFEHIKGKPRHGLAFFYFTFNDPSKQDLSSLLRALLLQLSGQCDDGEIGLARLKSEFSGNIPPAGTLLRQLQRLLQNFDHVYIVLDAIDESPQFGKREAILDAVHEIRQWSANQIHLLVTSRDLPDIRDALEAEPDQIVSMKTKEIDADVAKHILFRLENDRNLRKLSQFHDLIAVELTTRAHGVFRWVDCQFISLSSCPRSEQRLKNLLNRLPWSLNETYHRMLSEIAPDNIGDARRILTLVCAAFRPLGVEELIEGIAVDLNMSCRLDIGSRLCGKEDLLQICPGFLEFIDFDLQKLLGPLDVSWRSELFPGGKERVQFAHYSIQEYLLSEPLRQVDGQRGEGEWLISSAHMHTEAAKVCLAYLLEPEVCKHARERCQSDCKTIGHGKCFKFPFLTYAATNWLQHYQRAGIADTVLDRLALRLLQSQNVRPSAWLCNSQATQLTREILANHTDDSQKYLSPVYLASLLGLNNLLEKMRDAQGRLVFAGEINVRSGSWGAPLIAAAAYGHMDAVTTLINSRAEVNIPPPPIDPTRTSPLGCAAYRGDKAMVDLLLENGARIHLPNVRTSALDAAFAGGHMDIMRYLIEKGA